MFLTSLCQKQTQDVRAAANGIAVTLMSISKAVAPAVAGIVWVFSNDTGVFLQSMHHDRVDKVLSLISQGSFWSCFFIINSMAKCTWYPIWSYPLSFYKACNQTSITLTWKELVRLFIWKWYHWICHKNYVHKTFLS